MKKVKTDDIKDSQNLLSMDSVSLEKSYSAAKEAEKNRQLIHVRNLDSFFESL